MPAITQFPAQPKEVEDAITDERKQRAKDMELEWSYYFGEHKAQLKVREGQPDDNVILNVSGKLIDQGVSMLFGQGVKFELDELGETPQEVKLDEIWDANRRKILFHDVALNGYVTGHPVVKIVPQEDALPRIVNLNPAIVSTFWDVGDLDNVLGYVLSWNVDARQDIIKDGDTWLIRDYTRDRRNEWTLVDENRWEFPWPPVLDWKNRPNPNRYYGRSDLSHADLNDRINFVASNTNRIIKFHAHPKTIAKGITADEIVETAIDGLYSTSNEKADIYNLEMKGDLASSMAFLDMLRGEFYAEGGGVDLSTMQDKVGQLTNFGLRVLYKDSLSKLELKRLLYGEALSELARRLLEVVGMGDDNKPVVHWPDPLPENKLESSESLAQESALGVVSKQTMAADLGRDWETEQKRMLDEAETEGDLGTTLLKRFEQGRG